MLLIRLPSSTVDCRFGSPLCYKIIRSSEILQDLQKPCPFRSGDVVHIESDSSLIQETSNYIEGVSSGASECEPLYRLSEIYKKIVHSVKPVNFGVYKVENVKEHSPPSYYIYLSCEDCFLELPEILTSLSPEHTIPAHFLSRGGVIHQIIFKNLAPQHLNGYILPLFPSRCFIYDFKRCIFVEVEVSRVVTAGQRICYGDITILVLQSWPRGREEDCYSLPPCLYRGSSDDPR